MEKIEACIDQLLAANRLLDLDCKIYKLYLG